MTLDTSNVKPEKEGIPSQQFEHITTQFPSSPHAHTITSNIAVLDLMYNEALFPKHFRSVLERLTETSDKRDCAQYWVGCFTTTAQVFRNGKTSNGREEIQEMIERSWDNVEWRNHKPRTIYVLSKGANDVMVKGSTEYPA